MKPINLEMSAFGPYRDKTVVPFDAFGEGGLVLVTGDTGAGKTTIFDGICFALYGETSTDIREADTLRSDFADPETETYVRLVFTHRGKRYELTRNPNYMRPKKKGKKAGELTQEKADATLLGPDGLVVSGAANVTAAVEELLRMNRKQFKQIVMIAQGEFSRLLFAKNEEKGQIFRKVFHTDLYYQFQEMVKQRALAAEAEWKASNARLLQYKEGILADAEEGDLAALVTERSVHAVPACLALLAEQLEADEARRQALVKDGKIRQKELEALLQESEARRGRLEQWKKLQETEARIEKLQKQAKDYQEIEDRAARSEAVRLSMVPVWDAWQQERKRKAEREQQVKQAHVRRAMLANAWDDLMQDADPTTSSYYRKYRDLAAKWERDWAAYRQMEEYLLRAEESFFRNQAGLLAARLMPGEACPVCGSLEHPSPARMDEEVWEEAQVKALRQKRDAARKQIEAGKDALQKEKERAERTLLQKQSELKEQQAAVTAELARVQEELVLQKARSDQAQAAYEAQREALHFATTEDWQALQLSEREEKTLRQQVKRYQEECQAAAGARQALAEQLADEAVMPERLATQAIVDAEQLQLLRNQKTGIEKEEKRLYTKIQTNMRTRKAMEAEWAMKEEKEETYRQWKALADTAGGNLTGKEKLAFESFVQAFYFRQVLAAANGRLTKMTGGRFALVPREEASDRKRKAGLDLDVMDAYTGKARNVKSLSGGESFKASLSLALGLSDVVQQMAGGIEIDAMFIDEGFGALDEESLAQAVQTLNGLTEGSRFVGIISHVRELKEQIDKQMVITKETGGSHVQIRA